MAIVVFDRLNALHGPKTESAQKMALGSDCQPCSYVWSRRFRLRRSLGDFNNRGLWLVAILYDLPTDSPPDGSRSL